MNELEKFEKAVLDYIDGQYEKTLRESYGEELKYPFIVPGAAYKYQLWDWDSYFTDLAMTRVAKKKGTEDEFFKFQKGCILNFCDSVNESGAIPIVLPSKGTFSDLSTGEKNCAKPIICQHAEFVCRNRGDYEWLRPHFDKLKRFIGFYENNRKHESGLYFFYDDLAIGVDNDPCTFYRPKKSSASILLNCLMYKELLAMKDISEKLGFSSDAEKYGKLAGELCTAVRENCYDERNGFYYSADIDLLPVDPNVWLHKGCPRHWNTLIRKIDVWSGFMAMWAGIATPEQAERMVKENYLDKRTFNSEFGVRSLSKCEKMYRPVKSGNPSCWLGPVWGIANYAVFEGLRLYGYTDLARELCEKTVRLFGRDILECGEMHEYYDPETGMGLNNQGFQSWNLLIGNMLEESV